MRSIQRKESGRQILTGVDAPVYALAFDIDSGHVAVGIGSEVQMTREIVSSECKSFEIGEELNFVLCSQENYATFCILPRPPELPNLRENSDNRIRARSLHVIARGSKLVASYLNHGIM
jgi:hypothetical protein